MTNLHYTISMTNLHCTIPIQLSHTHKYRILHNYYTPVILFTLYIHYTITIHYLPGGRGGDRILVLKLSMQSAHITTNLKYCSWRGVFDLIQDYLKKCL